MTISRRRLLQGLTAAGVVSAACRWLDAQALPGVTGGRLVRTMPLGRLDRRPQPPFHQLLGAGLDARQFTDLSTLDAGRLVTPTPQFYIRTARPPGLPTPPVWSIALGGRVAAPASIDMPTLERESRDIGIRLMECAGNADPANFGLLSAAQWSGVPVATLLERAKPLPNASRIRITGFDDESGRSVTSNAGASWIFTRGELERTGAFLALRMNGAPLTPDHGAPIRLVVPNYYGCSCIKWVTSIDWVPDDEPATLQMMEFSTRTHQKGAFTLARDYAPPTIEVAATPVRVEQWVTTVGGRERVRYRVVGVRWGGTARTVPLTIRFRSGDPFVAVSDCPPTDNTATWSLWTHEWTPDSTGRYQVALGVSDPSIPARRLELYYYTREVEIDRV